VRLRVFQLNVLAQSLAKGTSRERRAPPGVDYSAPQHLCDPYSVGVQFYTEPAEGDQAHCFRVDEAHLQWPLRLRRIIKTVLDCNPDVVCLQEVDDWQGFLENLAPHGYDGRFCKKAGRSLDGSAIFWKTDKLSFVEESDLQFANAVMKALIIRLVTPSGLPVVVCATHLKAGVTAEMEEVRAEQAELLVNHLDQLVWDGAATILGADLNAHYAAFPIHRYKTPPEEVQPRCVPIFLDNGFRSAWGQQQDGGELPQFPSFTMWNGWLDSDVKGAFDYVLLRGPCAACAVQRPPPEKEVAQLLTRLPCAEWPSDHLPVVADVAVWQTNGEHSADMQYGMEYVNDQTWHGGDGHGHQWQGAEMGMQANDSSGAWHNWQDRHQENAQPGDSHHWQQTNDSRPFLLEDLAMGAHTNSYSNYGHQQAPQWDQAQMRQPAGWDSSVRHQPRLPPRQAAQAGYDDRQWSASSGNQQMGWQQQEQQQQPPPPPPQQQRAIGVRTNGDHAQDGGTGRHYSGWSNGQRWGHGGTAGNGVQQNNRYATQQSQSWQGGNATFLQSPDQSGRRAFGSPGDDAQRFGNWQSDDGRPQQGKHAWHYSESAHGWKASGSEEIWQPLQATTGQPVADWSGQNESARQPPRYLNGHMGPG
jgi:endonuclease/exonuclease/phosphatase family metal-dependent hydrolase